MGAALCVYTCWKFSHTLEEEERKGRGPEPQVVGLGFPGGWSETYQERSGNLMSQTLGKGRRSHASRRFRIDSFHGKGRGPAVQPLGKVGQDLGGPMQGDLFMLVNISCNLNKKMFLKKLQ